MYWDFENNKSGHPDGGGVYGDEGLQEIVVVIIQDTFVWGRRVWE
jgi:predicted outer membrane repeat protein